jgi:uncharacterized phage protein (TIGR01671 family)
MREIKFRAWHKAEKKMYGNPENTCWVEMLRVSGEAGFDECDVDLTTENGEGQSVSFDEVVLMQYTGLKDKNGKEIYEGDIIKLYPSDKSGVQILWDEHIAGFGFGNQTMADHLNFRKLAAINYEVIGNTYSSPELLGAK